MQPGAILKIVVEERIDDGERWHQSDKVVVLLVASQEGFRTAVTGRRWLFLLVWQGLNVGASDVDELRCPLLGTKTKHTRIPK